MPLPTAAKSPLPEKPTIIVGAIINYPPFEFIDKDGKPAGYGVDLTKAIAKVMGLNVQFSVEPWRNLFSALSEGKIHVMIDVAYTEQRSENFDYSSPHAIVPFSIFGRKDGPLLGSMNSWQGKDVMVLDHNVIYEEAIEKGWNNLTYYTTDEEMLRMLASGKHDYAILSTKVGNWLIRDIGLTNVVHITDTTEVFKYCFAGKKGSQALLDQFSEGLSILYKNGDYKKIYNKWLGEDLSSRGIPWAKVLKYGGIIAALFLAALILVVLWFRMLKKQVVQRTAALALEINERKRAEDELRSNQEQLVQTEKLAAIGTLVSGVAHEINNPNGLILMNVMTLMEMHKDIWRIADERYQNGGDFEVGMCRYSEVRENLGQMMTETVNASKRIARIVEDLKNFSRRDDPASNEEDLDLNAIVGSAIRLVNTTIRKSTESFVVRYSENLPKIRGNEQRIEQVVVNLVLNACQALADKEKGIELTTRYDPKNRTVVLTIADEGIGIAPEQLQYIADPFYTTKREHGGTGLGLSVSSTIVKEHKGILTFNSEEGKGTTATVSFPIT